MIKIETDLHTHTIASGHAYATVKELATQAKAAGLKAIAITDHGPSIPGTCHPLHFINQKRFHKLKADCMIFSGVEDDLIDKHGNLALDDFILDELDVVLVGNHPFAWAAKNKATTITDSLLKAMYKPHIKGITHPVNPWFDIAVDELVKNAKTSHTALEFNLSKISGLEDELIRMLELAAEYDAPIMINSDAHIAEEIGDFSNLTPFLNLVENLNIINSSLEKTIDFFDIDINSY